MIDECNNALCVKSVRIRSYSGPYFPTFGQNTDQNNSEYGRFSRSDMNMIYGMTNVSFIISHR